MNPEDFNPEIARLQLRLAEVRASARRAGRSRQALYELLAEILENRDGASRQSRGL